MTLRTYATVVVTLTAALLLCALVSMTLAWSEMPSEVGPRLDGTGARPGNVSITSDIDVAANRTPRLCRNELTQHLASMRDMHARFSGAGSTEARSALLPGSDRLMQEGLALMRTLRPMLPATETGEVIAAELTPAQTESVQDFLELMEALVVMKVDRDSVLNGNGNGNEPDGLGKAEPRTREAPAGLGPKLVRMRTGGTTELMSFA